MSVKARGTSAATPRGRDLAVTFRGADQVLRGRASVAHERFRHRSHAKRQNKTTRTASQGDADRVVVWLRSDGWTWRGRGVPAIERSKSVHGFDRAGPSHSNRSATIERIDGGPKWCGAARGGRGPTQNGDATSPKRRSSGRRTRGRDQPKRRSSGRRTRGRDLPKRRGSGSTDARMRPAKRRPPACDAFALRDRAQPWSSDASKPHPP